MAKRKLVYSRIPVRVSSSVANFKDKVAERINYSGDYKLFIGMYHWLDYLRLLFYRGRTKVFWCGSDILQLKWPWNWLIYLKKAEHICENLIEFNLLKQKGIEAKVQPVILTDPDNYPVSYRQNDKPHVFINCHAGREEEYGIDVIERIASKVPEVIFHVFGIAAPFHQFWFDSQYGQLHNYDYVDNPNIIYHGKVPEDEFNWLIKRYQAGLRLNYFDGFGEVLAKSILMGQYPISRIKYPYMDNFQTEEELIALLKKLKNRRSPNYNRDWWYKKLKEQI